MLEKQFEAILPQSFSSDGTSAGVVTVTDSSLFKVYRKVIISGDSLPDLSEIEVKSILSPTELTVGPVGTLPYNVSDISAYTVLANATISSPSQPRPQISPDIFERASYDEAPTVAKRMVIVDKHGNKFDTANPLPVAVVSGGGGGGGGGSGDGAILDGVNPLLKATVKASGALKTDSSHVTQPVSGPLTDTQLRATAVPVSGTVAVTGAYQATQPVSIASMPATPVTDNGGSLTVDGSISVSNFPATQPVSGTVAISGTVPVSGPLTDTELRASAVPVTVSGVATEATVDAINTKLPSLMSAAPGSDTGQDAIPVRIISQLGAGSGGSGGGLTDAELRATPVPVSGTVGVSGSVPVTGTFFQATQPVSIAATVATSGAVTNSAGASAVNIQDGGNSITVDGSVAVSNFPSSQAVTGPLTDTELRATPVPMSGTITANAGAGTFAVSATSLPLPTAASQEHVAAASPHAARLSDGAAFYKATTPSDTQPVSVAGTVTVSGPLTDTQLRATAVPVSGTFFQATQPVSIAASVAVTGPLTDTQLRATPVPISGTVTASGPLTDTQLRASAVPVSVSSITKVALTPASPTAATVGITSASAVASNASRKGLILTNTSSSVISFGLGTTAVLNSGITLNPGGVWVMDEYTFCTSAVNAIASVASSNLAIQEFS
jgi:hypothetical protein